MGKWEYIKLLSDISDRYGDKLLLLLERYSKNNLQEITFEEAKEFCEKLNKNKNKWAISFEVALLLCKNIYMSINKLI